MGEEEDTLHFLDIMSLKEKDTSKLVYTRNQQQIALFIRTYITKWNTSELQTGAYPNRRHTHSLKRTEKDKLLVQNILHNKEYINIMDDINKEKDKKGEEIRKQMKYTRNGNDESPAHILGSKQNMPQNSLHYIYEKCL